VDNSCSASGDLVGFIHNFWQLSTESVDNLGCLWINKASSEAYKNTTRNNLWINLWIRGVKSVDKPVDNFVDNFGLWISPELSTICPQESDGYPHFCPQAARWLFGLGKVLCGDYPHIHRPYYYYYSNKYMV
jgi:hypothetical protein